MLTTPELQKPLPRPADVFTDAFWDACRRHELIIPRCKNCNACFWYPRQECPRCLEANWEWVNVSGKGRVHTFTLVRQAAHPAFNDDVPYPYAIIQLDEGVRMISNVIGIDPEQLQVDQRVEVVFEEVTPEVTLFKFRPIAE